MSTYYSFLDGLYYVAKSTLGVLDCDSWTGQPKVVSCNFRQLCVQPLGRIDRKIMMYPVPTCSEHSQYYLMIDADGPLELTLCLILTIQQHNRLYSYKISHLCVLSVVSNTYTLTGHQLCRTGGRNPCWTFEGASQTYLLLVVHSVRFE